MTSRDAEDYWTGATSDATDPPSALIVETIKGVEPLGDQLGVVMPLTVPTVLHDVLFGQSELIEGRAILPLHTYAILDAAKVVGLAEMLEASELEHICLFQGEAADELRDVAPYLVRLDEANTFTRNLFTKGNAGWHLWDREPGIYLRSRESLTQMRQHFRKITRIRDEQNTWFYFRFWEPLLLRVFADQHAAVHHFWTAFATDGPIIIVDRFLRTGQVLRLSNTDIKTHHTLSLTPVMRSAMQAQRIESFARVVACDWLVNHLKEDNTDGRYRLLGQVRDILQMGLGLNITDTRHLSRFARIALTAQAVDEQWRDRPEIAETLSAGHGAGRLLPELEYRLGISEIRSVVS